MAMRNPATVAKTFRAARTRDGGNSSQQKWKEDVNVPGAKIGVGQRGRRTYRSSA